MGKHFAERARERIGLEKSGALEKDLKIAIQDPERWHEYIELVFSFNDTRMIYRFRVEQGIYYVLCDEGKLVTCLTQDMLKEYKKKHKEYRN